MRIYYEDSHVQLWHGDCRDVAPFLPVVDAIVTDPPYGETRLKWDQWVEGWPNLAAEKSNQLWCFGTFKMFMQKRDEFAVWRLAQDLIWEKPNGSGIHADRFRRVHEMAVHWYRGDWTKLYRAKPVEVIEGGRRKRLLRVKKPSHYGRVGSGVYEYGATRLRRSVLKVANRQEGSLNETQKPEGIVRPLLEYCVPVGGRVMDLFAGSGTVLAVAKSMGLRAIGIEKRECQCALAAARLSQVMVMEETQSDAAQRVPTKERGEVLL